MDERTELIETLSLIVRPENAAKMVDAFAHTLAEEIRAEAADEPIVPVYSGKSGPVRNSLLYAADLIDPEVKP